MNRKNILTGVLVAAGIAAALFGIVMFFKWVTPDALTNEQIISETKKCEAAGMKPSQIINGWTYDVNKVICTNKEGK